MWVGLLVRDSRAFYLKDVSVNHITPHHHRSEMVTFVNLVAPAFERLIVGLDEPVVLLNRDKSEQQQTHVITPCCPQRFLTRRNRSGRNLHVCRVTCRCADKSAVESTMPTSLMFPSLPTVTVPKVALK